MQNAQTCTYFIIIGGKEIPAKFVGAQLMDHWIFNFPVQAIWPLLIQGIHFTTICISNCISKSLHSTSLSILTNSNYRTSIYVAPFWKYLLLCFTNASLSKQFFSIDCAWFLLEHTTLFTYITIKLLWTQNVGNT